MIKMQNVRKTYPGFDFELSLEIPEGRITGLIGKNGAGKSTAIRLMLGLVKAESGTIELFGKPITEITMQDRTAAAGRKTAQGVFKWNEGETPRTDRAVTQSTASDS